LIFIKKGGEIRLDETLATPENPERCQNLVQEINSWIMIRSKHFDHEKRDNKTIAAYVHASYFKLICSFEVLSVSNS
jgi:hypothetical protein